MFTQSTPVIKPKFVSLSDHIYQPGTSTFQCETNVSKMLLSSLIHSWLYLHQKYLNKFFVVRNLKLNNSMDETITLSVFSSL